MLITKENVRNLMLSRRKAAERDRAEVDDVGKIEGLVVEEANALGCPRRDWVHEQRWHFRPATRRKLQ